MSNWINWRIAICRARNLSTTAKGLALYLNTYMNDRQDVAWPGISTICGEMAIAKPTAIKYLAELSEKGFLSKQKRFGKTTVYHTLIPSSSKRELVQDLNHSSSNCEPPVVQTVNPNKQDNKQPNKQLGRFTPPTVKDVAQYCQERGNTVDPENFFDHYAANGWMRGKTKIKDWKACVRTWEKSSKQKHAVPMASSHKPFDEDISTSPQDKARAVADLERMHEQIRRRSH